MSLTSPLSLALLFLAELVILVPPPPQPATPNIITEHATNLLLWFIFVSQGGSFLSSTSLSQAYAARFQSSTHIFTQEWAASVLFALVGPPEKITLSMLENGVRRLSSAPFLEQAAFFFIIYSRAGLLLPEHLSLAIFDNQRSDIAAPLTELSFLATTLFSVFPVCSDSAGLSKDDFLRALSENSALLPAFSFTSFRLTNFARDTTHVPPTLRLSFPQTLPPCACFCFRRDVHASSSRYLLNLGSIIYFVACVTLFLTSWHNNPITYPFLRLARASGVLINFTTVPLILFGCKFFNYHLSISPLLQKLLLMDYHREVHMALGLVSCVSFSPSPYPPLSSLFHSFYPSYPQNTVELIFYHSSFFGTHSYIRYNWDRPHSELLLIISRFRIYVTYWTFWGWRCVLHWDYAVLSFDVDLSWNSCLQEAQQL